jgi:hypothetical protein
LITTPVPVPEEIGGYRVVRALREGETFEAVAAGGRRRVVLKVLEGDCLLRGQLHPSVKERLARVRELAHPGVANLHGVERAEVGREAVAYLVWDYVAGRTIEEYAADEETPPWSVVGVGRELILAVESLHALGLVHGAIKGGNVFVGDDGTVKLTHVSPLLYHDPARDAAAVVALLIRVLEQRGEAGTAAGRVLAQAAEKAVDLPRLRAKLAAAEAQREKAQDAWAEGQGIRRRAMLGALAAAMAGAGMAYGVRWLARETRPRAPAPPQASPAAMESAAADQKARG